MNPQIFNQPFVQIALPLLIGMFLTTWATITTQNKSFDDFKAEMNRRFDDVIRRLDSIEFNQKDHETRITRVEERVSPILRR